MLYFIFQNMFTYFKTSWTKEEKPKFHIQENTLKQGIYYEKIRKMEHNKAFTH